MSNGATPIDGAGPIHYPEYADAEEICRRLGARVRDPGALASALDRPAQVVWGHEAYRGLHLKAAALTDAISRSHPLDDGNKRLAFLLTALLYAVNGYSLAVDPADGDAFFRAAGGESHLRLEEIADWFEARARPTG